MRRHANKVLYVLCVIAASTVVHVVGELSGTTWQITVATLFVLAFTSASTLISNGRIRDLAQRTGNVQDPLAELRKLVKKSSVRNTDNSARLASQMADVRSGIEGLASSQASLDSRTANLTQVATQLAVEMDFLLGILRHDKALVNHGDSPEGGQCG